MADQLPNTIRHKKAFRAWYEAGRKITDEVRLAATGKGRNTIYTWRDDEGWHGQADELDRKATEAMAVEYARDAADAQVASRQLTALMFTNAQKMNEMLQGAMNGQGALDEFTVQAIAKYSQTAIDSAAKLYQWAQKYEVDQRIETVTPDEEAAMEAELRELELLPTSA